MLVYDWLVLGEVKLTHLILVSSGLPFCASSRCDNIDIPSNFFSGIRPRLQPHLETKNHIEDYKITCDFAQIKVISTQGNLKRKKFKY